MQNKSKIVHKSGSLGGVLVGDKHSAPSGGIDAVIEKSGQPIKMEGGEVVITAPAVDDKELHEFEGEMLTNRQILSRINVSGGGVSFADGGEIPGEIPVINKIYKYGGRPMRDTEIVHHCGCQHKMAAGGEVYKDSDISRDAVSRIPPNRSSIYWEKGGDLSDPKPFRKSDLPEVLRPFVPSMQISAITGSTEHWDIIERLKRIVTEMPGTYDTAEIPSADKIVYLHYFYGESDWYIVEKDSGDGGPDRTQYQAFGYTILNGDTDMAEWGYISIAELLQTNRVELDFYFEPIRFEDLMNRESGIVPPEADQEEPAPSSNAGASAFSKLIQEKGFGDMMGSRVMVMPGNATAAQQNNPQSLLDTYEGRPQAEINNAIRAILREKGTERDRYSADELAFIEWYEGAGGLAGKGETGARLLDQFFTPLDICAKMWGLAIKYGFSFQDASILEPSFGSGRFFKFIPADTNTYVRGYDVDEFSWILCRVLYPTFDLHEQSFETMFFNGQRHIGLRGVDRFYDLVIGNPPYRDYVSAYSRLGEKDATGAFTFEMYFIMRGIDLLKSGGLLIYIIPNTFMSNDNKYNDFKRQLWDKAELLDAYRLPNDIFPNTSVGTDIIVLKKR